MSVRGSGVLLGAAVVGFLLSGPAAAQTPEPEVLCSIDDPRLDELSGLAARADRWYAVNDGGTQLEVFVLDRQCRVVDVIHNPVDPYDVEDLALAPDGTLWLGDTGDNRKRRDTVALHAVDPDGDSVLYRLTYPDGPHDAEALLLDRSGTPHIITKNVLGEAAVYRPAGPLTSPGPTPLDKVGVLSLAATDTPGGPVGRVGSILVTGAASTADGAVVAIRTYTDAYLYPAPDGDVVAALQRQPVRIPLPDERQGEAIAFTDAGTLLSAGEGVGGPVRAVADAASLVSGASRSAEDRDSRRVYPDAPDEANGAGVPLLPGIAIAVVVAAATLLGISKRRR